MYTDPERRITDHSKQFRQHKVKTFEKVKTNLPGWSCHISKQIMRSLVTGMSTVSLQVSWASASLTSNKVPDGVMGKIVQFMWHVKQQTVQVQCTTLLCQWSKILVIDCYWSNWSNIISKFGTFSCTDFYLVIFSKFKRFFFGLIL